MLSKQVIQQTVDGIHDHFKADLLVTDLEGRVLATAGSASEGVLVNELQSFVASGKLNEIAADHYFSRIRVHNEPFCNIAAFGCEDACEAGKFLERMFAIQLMVNGGLTEDDYYRRVISGDIMFSDMYGCASELDISADRPRILYVIVLSRENGMVTADRIVDDLRLHLTEHVLLYDQTVPVVIHEMKKNREKEMKRVRTLEKILTERTGVLEGRVVGIGQSRIAYSIDQLTEAYQEAADAVRTGRIFRRKGPIYRHDNLLLEEIVSHLPESFCRRLMKRLVGRSFFEQMDDETATMIRTFFDNTMSVAQTAEQTFFHRNTVHYRLNNIQEAVGLNIRTFNDASVFKMLWMICQYVNATDTQGSENGF